MLLDTNILIAYLNGEEKVIKTISSWKRKNRILSISPVSTAEVLALPNLSAKETPKVREFLGSFIVVPFDESLAETAAFVRRFYGLGLPDAIIAATSIRGREPLVTRDRQFRKVREITVVSL